MVKPEKYYLGGLPDLCRRTLGGERYRYANAWPGIFETDPMAIEGINDKSMDAAAERGGNLVSKHHIQPECGE